jgi:hypothetical protein
VSSLSLLYGHARIFVRGGHQEHWDEVAVTRIANAVEEQCLEALEERLRCARSIAPELINRVIVQACPRLGSSNPATKASVEHLVEAGAWVDVSLALLQIGVPYWRIRRLVFEDGEWLCSLSRQPWLPLGMDELAEARHELLPLSVLIALVQARRTAVMPTRTVTSVPKMRPAEAWTIGCDNYF